MRRKSVKEKPNIVWPKLTTSKKQMKLKKYNKLSLAKILLKSFDIEFYIY